MTKLKEVFIDKKSFLWGAEYKLFISIMLTINFRIEI